MSTATPNTPEPCDCSKNCIHRLKAREQEAWDFAFRHYDDPLARKIYFFLAKRGLPFDDATIDDIRQQRAELMILFLSSIQLTMAVDLGHG
jgi:hypothetical protein